MEAPLSSRTCFAALMGFVVALGAAHAAGASTLYRYRGNGFDLIADADPPLGTYTTGMRVRATIALSAPLAPNLLFQDVTGDLIGFSFTDGRNTLTQGLNFGFFSTNSSGEITEWSWSVGDLAPNQILTRSNSNGDFFDVGAVFAGGFDSGRVTAAGSAGRWMLVPEPATAALLAAGLGLLAVLPRQNRHP